MTNEVIEFMRLYLPKMIGAGFSVGLVIGSIAVLTGYGIKQALRLFDR